MVDGSIGRMQRNSAEVEHREDVRVADLVLQREAEDVVLAQRRERFEAIERQVFLAEDRLEVEPGSERPLAGPLRVVVHDRVEDLQAVMAHAERVGVGEAEGDLAANGAVVLGDAVELAAEILGGRLHLRQVADDGVLERRVEHRKHQDCKFSVDGGCRMGRVKRVPPIPVTLETSSTRIGGTRFTRPTLRARRQSFCGSGEVVSRAIGYGPISIRRGDAGGKEKGKPSRPVSARRRVCPTWPSAALGTSPISCTRPIAG